MELRTEMPRLAQAVSVGEAVGLRFRFPSCPPTWKPPEGLLTWKPPEGLLVRFHVIGQEGLLGTIRGSLLCAMEGITKAFVPVYHGYIRSVCMSIWEGTGKQATKSHGKKQGTR